MLKQCVGLDMFFVNAKFYNKLRISDVCYRGVLVISILFCVHSSLTFFIIEIVINSLNTSNIKFIPTNITG